MLLALLAIPDSLIGESAPSLRLSAFGVHPVKQNAKYVQQWIVQQTPTVLGFLQVSQK
jgi:hypothetical protein